MRKAFTLIELLVVIAILAVLAVVVVLTLNPASLLQGARDSNRISDMATLNSGISLFAADVFTANALGNTNVVYVSIPDPTATSTVGDQCQGLGLLSLPAGWTYQCAASSTFRKTDGTGWIPINFSSAAFGAPFGQLPVDPTNTSSSRHYYTYTTNGTNFEVTAVMESPKYKLGGSADVVGPDGGTLATVYEKGSKLGLEPLDYGDTSLVGLWTFDEGSGSVAYDYSGNNATGSWQGTLGSQWTTNAKAGGYAGSFDGTTNYVKASRVLPASVSTPFSLSAWINLNPTACWKSILSNDTSYAEITDSAGGSPCFGEDGGPGWFICSPAISTGAWHHIVGVYDGSNGSLYVDGVLKTGPTAETMYRTHGTALVGAYTSGGELMNGLIDSARTYNRALSAAEIQAMYNGGK
jgi:prepilin-type N-terminal cleavage/methylation domain-containing protein